MTSHITIQLMLPGCAMLRAREDRRKTRQKQCVGFNDSATRSIIRSMRSWCRPPTARAVYWSLRSVASLNRQMHERAGMPESGVCSLARAVLSAE